MWWQREKPRIVNARWPIVFYYGPSREFVPDLGSVHPYRENYRAVFIERASRWTAVHYRPGRYVMSPSMEVVWREY